MHPFTMFQYMALHSTGGSAPTPPTPISTAHVTCTARAGATALVGAYYLVSGTASGYDSVWYCSENAKYLYAFNGTWCVSSDPTYYPGIADTIIDTRMAPSDWSGVTDQSLSYSFTYSAV